MWCWPRHGEADGRALGKQGQPREQRAPDRPERQHSYYSPVNSTSTTTYLPDYHYYYYDNPYHYHYHYHYYYYYYYYCYYCYYYYYY